jgi:hypothetical protein
MGKIKKSVVLRNIPATIAFVAPFFGGADPCYSSGTGSE